MSDQDHFRCDPDWEEFARKNDIPLPPHDIQPSSEPIEPIEVDIAAARAGQASVDFEWAAAHPLEAVGYVARSTIIKVRDGTNISVKISYPGFARRVKDTALPVLFATHGGGWIQGSHTSEEAWLLQPLYEHLDLVIVSVEFRLAPEHRYPIWIEDSWDVLERLLFSSAQESVFSNLEVKLDLQKVILAGSSSGAGIAAALSQMCRDRMIPISGIVLNVPVLCDYRHFPTKYANKGHPSSYTQYANTFMGSGFMVWVWNLIHPSPTTGTDPRASPLLGDCINLPRHLIFVAGQDPVRDEGIAYATKLEDSGVPVEIHIYKGVPHNFSHFPELKATIKFWVDLRAALEKWLE
ncbi:hypothetical protein UA08_03510 [Talaromyces atroroseus]|uniref:Alpha/beta hydrolase fold-3 domain-containing protein n=1 Tax=Talaromyces atroroseus TaxID=1441469 RepID=A0A225B2N5_TALAT|nr:hypothetical protein UA08_03510 [Talaromyces atroroseus]OKL61526.1 hypothetical protein UA08_03510 [Talaromyces atroroseus]